MGHKITNNSIQCVLQLDDKTFQKEVLLKVDDKGLAKALKAVNSEVEDKFFRNMTKEAVAEVKTDMSDMGPVRLAEVKAEQQKIIDIIQELEESGKVTIDWPVEDEMAEQKDSNKGLETAFASIADLDDEIIQKMLYKVDTSELAKALKAVGQEVHDKIFKNLSERASGLLKEDMEAMGPVKLADVEAAQQIVVDIITEVQKEN